MERVVHSIAGRIAAIALAFALAGVAPASIDVALVPEQSPLLAGDRVRLRLILTADSARLESFASAQIILNWDPARLQLVGTDDASAVDLLTSGFPDDPYNLNEAAIPQDGTALYVAFAPLGNSVDVDEEGVLVTTLLFEPVAPASTAVVTIPPMGGLPATATTVFDGETPNLDVTGTISGAEIVFVAEPTRLVLDLPDHGLASGDTFTAALSMENLNGQEAAGFAAYLEYDPSEITFIDGEYTAAPFGAAIVSPITPNDGAIDLAAQIAAPDQAPASADAALAVLTFRAAGAGCVSSLRFRDATPGTRLTDAAGAPIGPLVLIDPVVPEPPLCDCFCQMDDAADIDVFDLLAYLNLWFAGDAGAERTGQAPGSIDVFDLLAFLDCWFAPPAGCS